MKMLLIYEGILTVPQPRHNLGGTDKIGMGWGITQIFKTRLIEHGGATGGYRSFIGFDKKQHKGVVLSNATNSIDDMGFYLLENQSPLAKLQPPKQHKAIKLDAKLLDAYVGTYQFAPNDIPKFSREGDRLFYQVYQQKFEMFPESETEFFFENVDAQVTFVKDAQGKVTHIVNHQNGMDMLGKKITDPAAKTEAAKKHQAIKLDAKIFDAYVGKYQLTPDIVLTFSRKGNKFFYQATGEKKIEISAETENDFYLKPSGDSHVTFVKDDKGQVTQLVLHRDGANFLAKKTE